MSAPVPAPEAFPRSAEAWLAEPHALVIWDMQPCIAGRAVQVDRIVDVIAKLAAAARDASVPVFYTRHVGRPWEQEDRVWRHVRWRQSGTPDRLPDPPCPDGVAESDIHPRLRPAATDVVLRKTRPTLFVGTDIADRLAAIPADVLLLTGVATDRGILSTTREALWRGVQPIVVGDAVSAFSQDAHRRGLADLQQLAYVVASGDVHRAWAAGVRHG